MANAVFSTAYLPPITYVSELIKFRSVEIEQHENYPKQTIRNRCIILSANGILPLHIPVMHEKNKKIPVKDVKISYREPWQRVHWAAIQSAYNKSSFFEFFSHDFEKIIFSNKIFLLDLNTELLCLILKILDIKTEIKLTNSFNKIYSENDFRFLSDYKSNTKYINQSQPSISTYFNRPYLQVFSYKTGFIPNLSIIDLLFNQGKNSFEYLG